MGWAARSMRLVPVINGWARVKAPRRFKKYIEVHPWQKIFLLQSLAQKLLRQKQVHGRQEPAAPAAAAAAGGDERARVVGAHHVLSDVVGLRVVGGHLLPQHVVVDEQHGVRLVLDQVGVVGRVGVREVPGHVDARRECSETAAAAAAAAPDRERAQGRQLPPRGACEARVAVHVRADDGRQLGLSFVVALHRHERRSHQGGRHCGVVGKDCFLLNIKTLNLSPIPTT